MPLNQAGLNSIRINGMRTFYKPISHKYNVGVGLIEVLIAMLVLAVGILGYVGLQTTAKRTGYEALQRSTAVYLANDILERMRNNPLAVSGGDYSVQNLGNNSRANDVCIDTPSCARYDLWEWEQRLDGSDEEGRGGLVSARGCISVIDDLVDNAGFVTVSVAWRGFSEGAAPNHPEDIDNCGEGLGLYDGDANDSLRQVVIVTSYINFD